MLRSHSPSPAIDPRSSAPCDWRCRGMALAFAVCAGIMPISASAQTLTDDLGGALSLGGSANTGIGQVTQIAFAPGDNQHAYASTFGNGVWRFDYDPSAGTILTSGVQVAASSSLGLAFHQDATLGTVMYYAPTVPFSGGAGFDDIETQSIVRLTDTNDDGTWGGAGDVNQAIVNNVRVTQLHQINQLQVHNNALYVAIGSSTQNGGITTPNNGDQSDPGETGMTGTVSFIQDLSLLAGDTATANTAGFTYANLNGDGVIDDLDVRSDTQSFTSTDPSKLRIHSTGFRNNYGLAFSPTGDLWVAMNQNEDPFLPDELHQATFQSDHGFAKANNMVGDWRTDGDEDPSLASDPSADAIAAGFFLPGNDVDPFITTPGRSANGLDFLTGTVDVSLEGDILLTQFGPDNVIHIDINTGQVTEILGDVNNLLDIQRDPFGNFLVSDNNGEFTLIEVATVPEPGSLIGLGLCGFLLTSRRRA